MEAPSSIGGSRMSHVLNISAIDYCRSQKLHELKDSILQALPVSSYPLPDGTHRIISQYSDEVWRLEDARFPSSVKDYRKKLRFNTLPMQFVEAVKFAFKHYDIKQAPSGGTLYEKFKLLKPFLYYLNDVGVESTCAITPLHCANYVHQCKQGISKQTKKPLSKSTIKNKFIEVETLYRNLKGTQWAFEHPWAESSATYLSGSAGQGKKDAKTQVIPDDELKVLINYCNKVLQQANEHIELKADVEIEREKLAQTHKRQTNISAAITKRFLKTKGYAGLKEFNTLYLDIPTAMAVIILAFSGLRIHELCAIQTDAYRVEDNDDDVYYWLKSHSSKTYEGYTEWLVPEIVIQAIEVQKAYIKPLQERLWQEQDELLSKDPHDPRGLKIEGFKHHLFLTNSVKKGNQINVLSGDAFNEQLKKFGSALGIEELASHRFRRTFAVYVAQSAYGDLRYLKQHFKHWGMDMTLLYAANEWQDEELYDEIAVQIKNFKVARVEEFLDEDTIITGGLANKLISYRSNNESIKTFESRAAMAERISDTVHLRPTGHSWCTSDNSGCGGRSSIEGTNCVDCKESIIEANRHGEYFKRVYMQQLELRQIDDIGEAGKQRVERDIERCERVLKDLGMWDEVEKVYANG
jgi:integrase